MLPVLPDFQMNSRDEEANYLTSPHIYRSNAGQEQLGTKYAFNSPQPMQHTLPTPYTLNQNKLDHINAVERDNSDLNDYSLVENSMLNHRNHQRHHQHSHRPTVDPNTSSNDIDVNSSQILTDGDNSINAEFTGTTHSSTSHDVEVLLSSSNSRASASIVTGSNQGSTIQTSANSTERNGKSSISSSSSSSSAAATRTAITGNNISQPILPDINEQPSSVLHFGNLANELLLASPEQFKEFLMDSPAGLNFWQQRQTPAKTPLKFVTNNTNLTHQQNNTGLMNSIHSPLQNIDVNLMFNSASKTSLSPPRKQMSLTPYGRRILNEMGTPFTKMMQPISSNNSALVDFHRARKHNLQSTPTSRPALRNESPGSKLYCSSPTTIQLHSSGVKCSPERDPNIDEKLFHLRASPTPKLSLNKSEKFRLDPSFELPKMGSFKEGLTIPSLRAPDTNNQPININNANIHSSMGTTHDISSTSEKVRKPKLNRNGNKNKSKTNQLITKQRFQIIMTDTTSFNSDDGVTSNNQAKLKRSRSVIVPGEVKKKKKKKKVYETSNIIPNSQ